MHVTREQIQDIARLARLELTEAEIDQYATQLSVVLGYMDMLHEVDTTMVPETCQVTGLINVVRSDDVVGRDEAAKKKLIAEFPDSLGAVLRVKQVFDT